MCWCVTLTIIYICILTFYNPSHFRIALFMSNDFKSYDYNWCQTYKTGVKRVHAPRNISELQQIRAEHMRVGGSMHSCAGLLKTDDIIDLKHFRGIDMVDDDVYVWAGHTIADVQTFLFPNRTLRGIGSIQAQTIGGAMSTSLAGVNNVAFSEFIIEAMIMDDQGHIRVTRDLYHIKDSMGTTGIVLRARIQTFKNVMVRREASVVQLDDLFTDIGDGIDSITTFSRIRTHQPIQKVVYRETADPVTRRPGHNPTFFYDLIVQPLTLIFHTDTYFWTLEHSIHGDDVPLSDIGHADMIFVQNIYIEYRIPTPNCTAFIRTISNIGGPGHMRIKHLRARNDSCMSNVHPVCKVEIYLPYHTDTTQWEDAMRLYGGYPHWGKYLQGPRPMPTCWNGSDTFRIQPVDDWNGYGRIWLLYTWGALVILITCFRVARNTTQTYNT